VSNKFHTSDTKPSNIGSVLFDYLLKFSEENTDMIDLPKIQNIVDNFSENTLSLYLNIDPSYIENQSQTPAWRIWLKNELKNINHTIDTSVTPIWDDINKRLNTFFSDYQINGRTLVLFMDQDQEYIHELPFTMRHRGHFGKPLVSPLLWAMDEYKPYLIVMVDQQQAIFRKAYLGNLETEAKMTIDLEYDWGQKTLMPASNANGQALRQGNNQDAFEDMISEHINRFYRDVADSIDDLYNQQSMRVILAGDERSAHAVQNDLHATTQKHLVGILPIPMNANEKEIMQRVSKMAYDYERNYEDTLISSIMSINHDNGRGILGKEKLAKAMEMQQVELIVMPFSLLQSDPEYAHELTMWTLNNNCPIEFVHGQAAKRLEQAGKIAARLYFSVETA